MYAVVACPRCRRARVVEEGRRTAACGACGRALALEDLRAFHTGVDAAQARHAAGLVNARLAGHEAEFHRAFLPERAPMPRAHDDAFQGAAAAARGARSETDRVDAIARSLTGALGGFGESDLERALLAAGLPVAKASAHLVRMVEAQVVHEPRPGKYRAL